MDEARNMALLFFVDHLMQKGGQRTIHDLSCQFGARGFTEEMRQAVGTTQEGLTEFLAQFPSLFTLDADQVVLKGFGETEGQNHLMAIPPSGRQRDYIGEAIQFFVRKLEKFGPELQIKSLLGHRSQAAPEIRLVSGRHLKEFVDFLAAQSDHFVVEGDRVRLRHMPEPKAKPEELLDEEGRPLSGHRAKLAAIEYMKSVLEQQEDQPIPLDNFYRRFCERFPHQVRQEVATNPKELLMFLKLNRHIFFIRSNKVQLVRTRPGGDEMGSESGRSTEGDGAGSERSGTSPPTGTAAGERTAAMNDANGQPQPPLFPLNRENLHRVKLVNTPREAKEMVHSLRAELDLVSEPNGGTGGGDFLTVDFKLVSLGQEQFVALIAVCCPAAAQCPLVLFDLVHSEAVLTDSGLAQLLEADRPVKVMHDARRAAPVLAQRYGLRMRNVFDTQIAHSVIQHHKFGKPMGELRAISFVNLQRVYFPQSLILSDVAPRKLSQTPNWADRPLSGDLLLSAGEECHCLANGLYRLLQSQMPAQARPLFSQLCADALGSGNCAREPTILPIRNGGPIGGKSNGMWAIGIGGHGGVLTARGTGGQQPMAPVERKVTPLMELPLNGIYRPPGCRHRGSLQLQPLSLLNGANGGVLSHSSLLSVTGGYVPPPLRKVSAPVMSPPATGAAASAGAQQLIQHRSTTYYCFPERSKTVEMCEAGTQTLSTGEIAVLNVYYDEQPNGSNGSGKGRGAAGERLQEESKTANGSSRRRAANLGQQLSSGTSKTDSVDEADEDDGQGQTANC